MSTPKRKSQKLNPLEQLHLEEKTYSPNEAKHVGVSLDRLEAIFRLESIRGFGPQKFRDLHRIGLLPEDIAEDPKLLPFRGKTGQALLSKIIQQPPEEIVEARLRAIRQLKSAIRLHARLLTYESDEYPRRLFDSNNAVPVLFARGNTKVLRVRFTVACVGSRGIEEPYTSMHRQFAGLAARRDAVVVSGFALGADTVGHRAATEAGGKTICVMPGGLDRPFPPENKQLWESFLINPGVCAVSEFQFGRPPAALTLRKRNKLITALAAGVLVSQSAINGGAMNAYRFAMEQRRSIATFASNGEGTTSGNRAISESDYSATTTFPNDSDEAGWNRWLDELSASI